MTPFEARLTNMLQPSIEGMGYELVRVMMRGDTRKTLQVMAERKDRRGMTTDDCEKLSETISAVLDVHDPIKERYALEVSSPGIDRPLTKAADFARYVGFDVKIDLKEMDEGRRHLNGVLKSADETNVVMTLEGGVDFLTPLSNVFRAKLILTDALIDAHLAEQRKYETINQEPVSVEAETTEEN